jgi:hypothetical protein
MSDRKISIQKGSGRNEKSIKTAANIRRAKLSRSLSEKDVTEINLSKRGVTNNIFKGPERSHLKTKAYISPSVVPVTKNHSILTFRNKYPSESNVLLTNNNYSRKNELPKSR